MSSNQPAKRSAAQAPSRVAANLYLGPLYGGLTAWVVLGESLGWHHVAGAALILPGIYLASKPTPIPPDA